MNQPISQNLTNLIPTLNASLPTSLVDLATSLLAQSRSRASNLKPEEEIARSYACANIACERLKQQLNLPKITPLPPCPPRIYNKLYKYLDGVLPAGTKPTTKPTPTPTPKPTPRRSSTKTDSRAKATASRSIPNNNGGTPSKRKRAASTSSELGNLSSQVTKGRSTAPRRIKPSTAISSEALPAWIISASRNLSTTFSLHPDAVPHILNAMNLILNSPAPHRLEPQSPSSSSPEQPQQPARKSDQPASLLVAVFLLVSARLSSSPLDKAEYVRRMEGAIATVRERLQLQLGGDDSGSGNGNGNGNVDPPNARAVDVWLEEIDKVWKESLLQDLVSLPRAAGSRGQHEEHSAAATATYDYDTDGGNDDEINGIDHNVSPTENTTNTLQSGLGTMMQARLDYTSEANRLDFLEWKDDMLDRIQSARREQESDLVPSHA
ncbi:MAG: hypothetical protein M1825_004558 [Sarcosagium campestre]|nr:MAG: hypothetical protein M1825_004558 [Sarcosagium campestre]